MSENLPPHGWLVIACKGGWEQKAHIRLTSYGHDVKLFWELNRRLNRGTPTLRREPALPGYLFLLADKPFDELGLGKVMSCPGVLEILHNASPTEITPAIVPDAVIAEVERLCTERNALVEAAGRRNKIRFEQGEAVNVIAGPFAGTSATVSNLFVVSPDKRIQLVLDTAKPGATFWVKAAHVAQTATIMGGGAVPKRRQSP